jgi:hypothetical protein
LEAGRRTTQVTRILPVFGILLAIVLIYAPFAVGTPEMAKKENKACTFCHTAVGKPDLNDAGKYYKEKKTLVGYKPKPSGS